MKDVSLEMGGRVLLRGVDLEVEAGETAVIAGEVGSGKSSLLRLILGMPGMQREDEVRLWGDIFVDGQAVFALALGPLQELRQQIGLVKGEGGLIENMDVRSNITLPLNYHARNAGREGVDKRYEEVMTALGIEALGLSGHRPVALTGEERAYVALARAFIIRRISILS